MIFPKMMAAGKAETVDFKRKEVPEMLREKIRKKLKGSHFVENLQTLRSVGYILKDVE